MRRIADKLKSRAGLSFTEMLACVVVLVLVSLTCMTGLNLAVDSHNRSLYESNSQMLGSTLNTAIGDVLRYARAVTADAGTGEVASFYSQYYGVNDGGFEVNADGHLTLRKGDDDEDADGSELLLGRNAYAKNLKIENFTLTYDGASGVFTGSYDITSTVLSNARREMSFKFRTIAE